MAAVPTLEAALKRDRAIVAAGLLGVIALAWAYVLAGAGMDVTALRPMAWTPVYGLLVILMWWIMMAAMMLPSAAPMILLFAAVNRKQRERGASHVPTGAFLLGYLLVWCGFSLVAAGVQWGLARLALLSPMMATTSVVVGGVLLLAAGLYQVTPLKQACLRKCRSPFAFVSRHWRPGTKGAVRMGVEHGAFCLGCCWVLMALLFYGGVMNPYWIIGIAIFVLIEKTFPAGRWLGSVAGVALILWGGALIVA
jgi:predicted metal-binding membrane protein